MKIPTGENVTPQYVAACLHGSLMIAEMALRRIADPECETFHGSRDRVASDALNKIERLEETWL